MKRTPFLVSDTPHGPLKGDVYLPEETRGAPVVVGCHGFFGFKDWGFWPETGARLAGRGLALVTFNFSGAGIGEDPERFTEFARFEENTIGRELDDLGRVLTAVTSREIPLGGADIRRLGLLGHSRGGGVVLLRASRDPRVRGVVTWAAVADFRRFTPEEQAEWRQRGVREVANKRTGQLLRMGVGFLEDLDAHQESRSPLEAVRRLNAPTLLLHGTRDEAVSPDDAARLGRAAAPGMVRTSLIQGGTHTFGATHPFGGTTRELDQVLEKTGDWFLETLII